MLVLVLRHGEREDEAMGPSQRCRMSTSRRFDPALTTNGHRQAREAWEKISTSLLSTLQPKKVAIFASPLRRAIGTAMMASEIKQEDWNISLPVDTVLEEKCGEDPNPESLAIPIVIWNGLCDCAAQMHRIGGHRNAIKTNFISCAVRDDLTPSTFWESSMATTWGEIAQNASAANTAGGLNNALAVPRMVQFWKTAPHKWEEILLPMTPKLFARQPGKIVQGGQVPSDDLDNSSFLVDSRGSAEKRTYKVHEGKDGERPIDQVVRQALLTNCDVCIVVSHREEIRDLHACHSQERTPGNKCPRLPYCCIGTFSVSESKCNTNRIPELFWSFHDILPYQEMTPEFIRTVTSGP